jgi:hypothetical protein
MDFLNRPAPLDHGGFMGESRRSNNDYIGNDMFRSL